MNRCFSTGCQLTQPWLLTIAVLAFLPPAAWAQSAPRPFPPAALRGMLLVTQPPDISLNGQPERLSPGARIKGTNNLLLMPATLVGQPLLVNYVREAQGLVREIWVLTEAEALQKRPGMDRTNIVFASEANKPATDDGKTPFDQLPAFSKK